MPSLDSRTRSKLVWIAALLSPFAAVQGVRLGVAGAGPADAAAATAPGAPPPAPVPVPAAVRAPSEAQRRALDWIRARDPVADLRSPMDHPDPEPDRPGPAATPEAPAPADLTPRQLTLTGLIGGADKAPVAAINHRLYRVGDAVSPGWSVAAIDARARSVTLAGPDGRTLRLTPPTPPLSREDR